LLLVACVGACGEPSPARPPDAPVASAADAPPASPDAFGVDAPHPDASAAVDAAPDAFGADAPHPDASVAVDAAPDARVLDPGGDPGTTIVEAPWTPLGPAPGFYYKDVASTFSGRVTGIALASATRWYIAAAGGGVWRSDDGGGAWRPLTDALATLAMSAIAVDPADPNTVWAATGEANCAVDSKLGAGILRSKDGGMTWTVTGAAVFGGAPTGRIEIDPRSTAGARTLYAAASYCTDWPQSYGLPQTGGLAKSTDDGRTWSFVADPAVGAGTAIMDVAVDPAGVIYAGRWGKPPADDPTATGIYKSTDGGAHFTRLGGGLPADWTPFGRIALAIAPGDAKQLYAVVAQVSDGAIGAIFRSNDAGMTWTPAAVPDQIGRQAFYNLEVAVDPRDPRVVYAGAIGLKESVDGGDDWTDLYAHQDQHAIAILPSSPYPVVFANDTGVYQVDGDGPGYLDRNGSAGSALAITQGYAACAHPTDSERLYLGTQDVGFLAYDGQRWTTLLFGDSGQCAVDWQQPLTVYESSSGYVERSDDGGQSFAVKHDGIALEGSAWISPLVLDPTNPQTLFEGVGRVYRSTDRADHWTPLMTEVVSRGFTAIAVGAGAIYAGDLDGLVWISRNDGASWNGPIGAAGGLPGEKDSGGRPVTSMAVDPQDATIAYITYTGYDAYGPIPGHVFRTIDGGASWQDIGTRLGDEPASWILVDPAHANVVYLATDTGVYRSSNHGSDWAPINNGLPHAQVLQLVLSRTGDRLYAVTHGRGLFVAQRTGL
jgi:photosystem II stability/assembly factor-like uncharacterized protein